MDENFIMNGYDPLQSTVFRDMMYLDGKDVLVVQQMIKENYVTTHHRRKISYLDNKGLWRTFVGSPRKEVTRKTKEQLIEYLYRYYKAQELSTSTLRDVFERCEDYRRNVLNRSDNTIQRDYQVMERFFTETFMSKNVMSITDDDISMFFNARSKELHIKERVLKDSLQLLIRTLDFAMKHEKIINDNPATRVDLQNYYQNCDNSVKTSDEKIFTASEIEAMKKQIRMEMSAKDYDPYGYAMLFSIETGVRVGDLPSLRWSDITEKGIHIHKQQRANKTKGLRRTFEELPYTKNERKHPKGGRLFPLTDVIVALLDEIRKKQDELGIHSEFIFCNADGSWLNKESYAQRLRRMCRRMGLTITNNHAFRMSLNSNVLIPMGIPVTQRAYLLGHSVETNERFYSHMRTETLEEVKNKLNQSTHTHSHINIVKFPDKKIPQTL